MILNVVSMKKHEHKWNKLTEEIKDWPTYTKSEYIVCECGLFIGTNTTRNIWGHWKSDVEIIKMKLKEED